MTEVRGQPLGTAGARDEIAASASSNTRVNGSDLGGRQRHSLTRAQRRLRYIGRLQRSPDAEVRWLVLLARLGQRLDDDLVDKELDAAVGATEGALQLFVRSSL
jgi:hypothetical protein